MHLIKYLKHTFLRAGLEIKFWLYNKIITDSVRERSTFRWYTEISR